MYFILHIIHLCRQRKACGVQERIPRLIRLILECSTIPVLSLLASNRNRQGTAIHPSIPYLVSNLTILLIISNLSIPLAVLNLSIPLVVSNLSIPLLVKIGNSTMKVKTMLNSLLVRYSI